MTERPTGTVTFVFTDIEGSTNLARVLGDRWPDELREHHQILRDAIERHAGILIGTDGDAIFAVFSSAADAVRATVSAQRTLLAHSWPRDAAVRVRMGIHTGEGRLADGEYVGLGVHLAARISAAAHGGQVLLSGVSAALASDHLPDRVAIRSLGDHRLKDFDRPLPIFQLAIDGLQIEFPPIRTLEIPMMVPTALTSFVGRDRELAELEDLLRRTRLLTLVGPGGTGKTRLLLEIGARFTSRVRDGVYFVDLASTELASLVPSAIVRALGLREGSLRTAAAAVIAHLRDRNVLLLLDNFEQLLDAAPFIGEILKGSPKSIIAVTSRIRLGLVGEQEYPVPPLAVPDSNAALDAPLANEAVALFVDRARAVRPSFAITPENATTIAEICARLDGLPLAIELAAAQLRVLTPAELLAKLEQGFPLRTSAANVPERQRTLGNAVTWSYEHLELAERRLFARLSTFAGGGTLEAIGAIGEPGGEPDRDVVELLASLVDQSLIHRVESGDGSRFTMLRPIREYAHERLDQEFDLASTADRHASFFTALAERWGPAMRSADAVVARAVLSREHDNLREAARWALGSDRADAGLRLVAALWMFWVEGGHLAEGASTARAVLELSSARVQPARLRAAALVGLAGVVYWQGDYSAAIQAYRVAVEIYRGGPDQDRLAEVLRDLGYTLLAGRHGDEAITIIEECLRIASGLDARQALVASATGLLGVARAQRGDLDDALVALLESLRLFEGTPEGGFWVGEARGRIGAVYRLMNRLDEAEEILAESLRRYRELQATVGTSAVLKLMADVASRRGDHERAVRLVAFSELLDERMGGGPPENLLLVGTGWKLARVAAETTADRTSIDRWRADGRAMTYEQAIAYALREAGSSDGFGPQLARELPRRWNAAGRPDVPAG